MVKTTNLFLLCWPTATLTEFIVPSAIVSSLIVDVKMAGSKNGSKDREPKCSYYPVKWAASLISMREEQRLAKQRKRLKKNQKP